MKRFLLGATALIVAASTLVGCGSPQGSPSPPRVAPQPATIGIPRGSIVVPPESARTPEGAKPQAPPVSLVLGVSEKHIDATGLHLIEGFEGYSRCAYWDPYGGVWTVGFGQTKGAYQGFCFSGVAAAAANLKLSVEGEYEWALRALDVSLNQNQWDALCSFVYNLGAGIFEGTTVGADLRAGEFYFASRQMLAYDHAGGVVLPGLRTRREDEVRLFLTPVSPPKPTHAQIVTRERRELDAHYRLREQLRVLLSRHDCRRPPWSHPRPNTRAYKDACRTWLAQGAVENREISRFHRLDIY